MHLTTYLLSRLHHHTYLKKIQLGIKGLCNDIFKEFFEHTILIDTSFIKALQK